MHNKLKSAWKNIDWKTTPIKSFLYYTLSFGFVKGTSFLLIPIYANNMEKAEYGHLAFLITLLSLFSLITDLGLNNGLYRFIKNKKRDSYILSNTIFVSFIFNVITYLFVLLIFQNLASFSYEINLGHLTILFASLIISSFTMLNLTCLRIYNKSFEYMIISVLQPVCHLAIFIILIFMDNVSINTLLISTLFSNILTAILSYIINKKMFSISIRAKMIKKLLNYTIGTTVSVLALYFLTGFDKLFLSYYMTPEALADYSIILLFSSMTILLMEPISLWYFANRFKIVKENKSKFEKITSMLVITNIWIAVLILINVKSFFYDMLPENYELNLELLILAIISFHLKYLGTILNVGCFIGQNTNIVAKINIFSAFVTLGMYVLVSDRCDCIKVMYAVIVGYSTLLILNVYFSQNILKINYKKNEIFINYFVSILLVSIIIYLDFNILLSNVFIGLIFLILNIRGFKNDKHIGVKKQHKAFDEAAI
jgi:O-antigen/teichoic acid export membrane protein